MFYLILLILFHRCHASETSGAYCYSGKKLTWISWQDKQVTRTVALAMALTNIAAHSSLYTPLRNPTPPALVPGLGRLTVDFTSAWHCSALLSAAIETSTLPTRLHHHHGGRGRIGRLDDLAAFLNVNGGQNIATLAMSVGDGGDAVRPKSGAHTEVNCSWGGGDGKSWRRDTKKEDHVFAETHVLRGFEEQLDGEEKANDGPGDARRTISRWGNPCRSAPSGCHACFLRIRRASIFWSGLDADARTYITPVLLGIRWWIVFRPSFLLRLLPRFGGGVQQ